VHKILLIVDLYSKIGISQNWEQSEVKEYAFSLIEQGYTKVAKKTQSAT
jgi:hypothetical protein